MRPQTSATGLDLFRHRLCEQVNPTHPSVRLTASPLYLKHTFDLSVEKDQLATGKESLPTGAVWRDVMQVEPPPIDPLSMTHLCIAAG